MNNNDDIQKILIGTLGGLAYSFGALASLELFTLLHGSSVDAILTAMGAR